MDEIFRPQDQFQREVIHAVARITTTSTEQEGDSQGTGFIYGHVTEGSAIIFLITNKHVIEDANRRINVNFNKVDLVTKKVLLGDITSFTLDNLDGYYYTHPDENIDLACINISSMFVESELPFEPPFIRQIRGDIFESPNSGKFLIGDDVWFVGFPDGRFDIENNLPITRRGYIATAPYIDFNGSPQFLIDAQVFTGSSGSPVFSIYNNEAKLIGIISDTLVKNERLRSIPAKTQAGVEQILGLGVVIKVEKITELIENAASIVYATIEGSIM